MFLFGGSEDKESTAKGFAFGALSVILVIVIFLLLIFFEFIDLNIYFTPTIQEGKKFREYKSGNGKGTMYTDDESIGNLYESVLGSTDVGEEKVLFVKMYNDGVLNPLNSTKLNKLPHILGHSPPGELASTEVTIDRINPDHLKVTGKNSTMFDNSSPNSIEYSLYTSVLSDQDRYLKYTYKDGDIVYEGMKHKINYNENDNLNEVYGINTNEDGILADEYMVYPETKSIRKWSYVDEDKSAITNGETTLTMEEITELILANDEDTFSYQSRWESDEELLLELEEIKSLYINPGLIKLSNGTLVDIDDDILLSESDIENGEWETNLSADKVERVKVFIDGMPEGYRVIINEKEMSEEKETFRLMPREHLYSHPLSDNVHFVANGQVFMKHAEKKAPCLRDTIDMTYIRNSRLY